MREMIIVFLLVWCMEGKAQTPSYYARCLDQHCYTQELLILKPNLSFELRSFDHHVRHKRLEKRGQWKTDGDSLTLSFSNSEERKFILKQIETTSFVLPVELLLRWTDIESGIRQAMTTDEELFALTDLNPPHDESYHNIMNNIVHRIGVEVLYEKMRLIQVYISSSE